MWPRDFRRLPIGTKPVTRSFHSNLWTPLKGIMADRELAYSPVSLYQTGKKESELSFNTHHELEIFILTTLRRAADIERFKIRNGRRQIIDHGGARLVSWDSGVGLQECLTIRTSGPSISVSLCLVLSFSWQSQQSKEGQDSVVIGQVKNNTILTALLK